MALVGVEIGSAQGNPYWGDDDDWSSAAVAETVRIFEMIANRRES